MKYIEILKYPYDDWIQSVWSKNEGVCTTIITIKNKATRNKQNAIQKSELPNLQQTEATSPVPKKQINQSINKKM